MDKKARTQSRSRHVVIIVQHLPVPLVRRVWVQCLALVSAGYRVSVICPAAPEDAAYEELEGVRLHRYPSPPKTRTIASYVYEFLYCWAHTALRLGRIFAREGFDVIQTSNPPDTYFLMAAPFKLLGKRFVYDQQDLCPEMYMARFRRRGGPWLAGLRVLERLTYRVSDHVVVPNDSYRRVALSRGAKSPERVTVVLGAPDLDRMHPRAPDPSLRQGKELLCCYVGIMGPQDRVDIALRAVHRLVHELGRRDCHFAFLGFGDCLDELVDLARELKLDEWVTFTGMADAELVARYLSTADVGLVPEPWTPYSDMSSMTKVLEYMAFGVPLVAFDLTETRKSAQDAAVYVPDGDLDGFVSETARLLDDPGRRAEMGAAGCQRIKETLGWSHQAPRYVSIYESLLSRGGAGEAGSRRSAMQ